MGGERTRAACLKSAFEWQPFDPRAGTVPHNFTLDRQVAQARAEIGEDRWAELQAEWLSTYTGKEL